MNLWQSDIFSSQIEILNFIIVCTGSSITLYDILSVDCRIYIILKSPFFPQLTSILESLLKSKSTIYKCHDLSLYDAIFYSVLHTPYIIFVVNLQVFLSLWSCSVEIYNLEMSLGYMIQSLLFYSVLPTPSYHCCA